MKNNNRYKKVLDINKLNCLRCKKTDNCRCRECLSFYATKDKGKYSQAEPCINYLYRHEVENCLRHGKHNCFIEIGWVDEIKYKKFLDLREKIKDLIKDK